MHKRIATTVILVLAVVCSARVPAAQPVGEPDIEPSRTATSQPFLLAPPKGAGPVVERARFALHDINEINDGAETFEFAGVLTLTWHDPRQAFDPAVVGVDEKIFHGGYQVNELSTGWYPQVVLVNESGLYQKNGRRAACTARRNLDPDRDPERDGEGGVQHEPIPVRRAAPRSRL